MYSSIIKSIGKALFEQDVPDFSNFVYCVALDIGGGNCSAAVADLRKGQDSTPQLLKLSQKGETCLWSNIGYETKSGKEGKISIGKRAQNKKYQYSNYKIVPTDENLELEVSPDNYRFTGDFMEAASVRRSNRELTRDYIRELFQCILRHPENKGLRFTPLDKILVIVGHPSSNDWMNKQAHKNLMEIVREATGVSTVLTTSESNSAILYALNNRTQIGAADRILIVDLGAYSADITWIDRRKLERRYTSIALGGKAIDRNIAAIILENSGYTAEELDQDYNLIYEARNVKEDFWPRGNEDEQVFIRASGQEIEVSILANQFDRAVKETLIAVQDTVTGQEVSRSYTGHLSAFLDSAKTKLKITGVDWVLVTGGAARMKPAMETIRSKAWDLWSVNEEHVWPSVIQDHLIDESVPFGSLQFCVKSRDVLDGIPNVYDKLKKEAGNMVRPIANKVGADVTEYLLPNAIEKVVRRFRDTEDLLTIEKLEIALKVELNQDKHKKKIQKLAEDGAKTIAEDHKSTFQNIITEFLEELYGRKAGTAAWKWGSAIDPNITFDGKVAETLRNAVTEAVSAGVLDVLLSIIVLLTAAVWLVILIASLVVDEITERWRNKHWTREQWAQWEKQQKAEEARKKLEEEKKKQEERRKVRSKGERKKIYKNVMSDKTKADLQEKVIEKLHEQLKNRCDIDGFGVPGAYLEQLKQDICNAVYTGL